MGIVLLLFCVARGPAVDVAAEVYARADADFCELIDRRLRRSSLMRLALFSPATASLDGVQLDEWCRGQRSFRFPGDSDESAMFVQGPTPSVAGVRVDAFPLEAAHVADLKSFTAECWFRWHGKGSRPGPNATDTASIMSFGDAINHGWGLSLNLVTGHVTFSIGRDKPQGAASITSVSRIPPHVWVNVAVVRDADNVRCYVNGLLSAIGKGVGVSGAAPPWAKLRLGYVGNGLGSAVCDFAGAALYDQPLTDRDVFRLNHTKVSAQMMSSLLKARTLLAAGQPSEAIVVLGNCEEATSQSCGLTEVESYLELEQIEDAARSAAAVISSGDDAAHSSTHSTTVTTLSATDFTKAAVRFLLRAVENGVTFRSSREHRLTGQVNAVRRELSSAAVESLRDANAQYAAEQLQICSEQLSEIFTSTMQSRLQRVCGACHHADGWITDERRIFSVQQDVDAEAALLRADLIEVLASRTMPPRGSDPLSDSDRASFLQLLRDLPERQSCSRQETSQNRLRQRRRLTRTEFRNSLFDLVGIWPGDALLPPSDGGGGEGFDTAAGTLTMSLSTAEQMHNCIAAVVRTGVGEGGSSVLPQILNELDAGDPDISHSLLGFAERAWCRTLTADDRELIARLTAELRVADANASEQAEGLVAFILMSGDFLYPWIRSDGEGLDRSARACILARRLALFLWSSHPDATLLQRASDGSLLNPRILESEVQRMLADPRAASLGYNFGEQWLGIRGFTSNVAPENFHPSFTLPVREALMTQAGNFIASLLTTDRPLGDLLRSRVHWMNDDLADFYGFDQPGTGWRQVSLPDEYPGGVVGLGAVLASTSYPARTSPVLRGRWILDHLLGVRVQPPPPDVPPLPETDESAGSADMKTLMEQHRRSVACRGCHAVMDPVGLTLEGFDAVGRRRRGDEFRATLQPRGVLPDGTELVDAAGLEGWLQSQSRAVYRQFARKLLGYATGRRLTQEEICEVDRILDACDASSLSGRMLVQKLVLSRTFLGWSPETDEGGSE